MKNEIITFNDPKSPIAEVFKTLRTNMQFMNTKKQNQSILVTSTLPGEGKSYISINLAVAFAQSDKKVLIIDADMRKGRQYKILDALPNPGLSDYLSGINEDNRDISEYVQTTRNRKFIFYSSR